MRPNLTKDISISDFTNYYWLKEELQVFCREHQLKTTGPKQELTNRIKVFLTAGFVKENSRPSKKRKPTSNEPLHLHTVITEDHRCSQNVRSFSKSAIGPNFHFSTHIQNYFKNNIGKTYKDAIEAWYEEEERKKDPSYQTKISPQFEYNQFIRDFFSDHNNQGKTRQDAIEAWNNVKRLPGSNKYIPQK